MTPPSEDSTTARPIDDIRNVTDILSAADVAEIEAEKAEAAAELATALSGYWESAGVSSDSLRVHDPSELIPFFEKYAERQFDSWARRMLPYFSSMENYVLHLAIHVTDSISHSIRPRAGIPQTEWTGGWKQFWKGIQAAEPGLRERLISVLSDQDGDWEIYVPRAFFRQVAKTLGGRSGQHNGQTAKATQALDLFFRLKYQLHLRYFLNWCDFDTRLRAHVSDRLEYWGAQAVRRAVGTVDQSRSNEFDANSEIGQAPDSPTTHQQTRTDSQVSSRQDAKKGNLRLLTRADGVLYKRVDFPTAEGYAGISPRRRQQLINKKILIVVGGGQKRRISVESLIKYCPPVEDAK